MQRNAILKSVIAVLGLCALTARQASAQTVTGTVVVPSYKTGITINYNGNNLNTSASNFVFTKTADGIGLPSVFDTYCVDLDQFLTSPVTYNLDSISNIVSGSPTIGGKIGWLYDTYAPLATNNKNLSAALQIAIWEVRYDGGGTLDLNAGTVKFSNIDSSILTQAQTYLSSIGTHTADATWLKSSTAQDLVGPQRTPEPGAFALLAAGLPLIGLLRRRK